MDFRNVQRFITAFLAVAVLLGSSAFAYSLYTENPPLPKASLAPALPDAPFLPPPAPASADPEITALDLRDQNNLTNQLAVATARQLINDNPRGPVTDEKGNLKVTADPANLSALVDNYLENHPQSPDRIIPKVTDADLNLTGQADTKAVADYFSQLGDAASAMISGSPAAGEGPEAYLGQSIDILQKAAGQVKAIKTPRPIAEFHRSLVFSLQLSKNFTELMEKDPVAAAALMDDYERQLTLATDKLEKEGDRLEKLGLLRPEENRTLVQRLLGIPTAYAAAGIGVPVTDKKSIWIQLKEWYYKHKQELKAIALDFLKNRLLKAMTAQVINWVAGGPEPQFVTDWGRFLHEAESRGIGLALEQILPAVCGTPNELGNALTKGVLGQTAQFIRDIMQPMNTVDGYMPYQRCTLDRAVQNIKDFERDLRNGGWVSYAQLSKPQNTFMGNIIAAADQTITLAGKQRAQDEQRAASGGGFKGQMLCEEDNNNPPLNQQQADLLNAANKTNPVLSGVEFKEYHAGDCVKGSPHVATPGVFSKDLSQQGFNVAYNRITNDIHDYKALLAFVADAALSRFMKEAAKGLLSYARKSNRRDVGPVGGGGSPTPPVSQAPEPETEATTTAGKFDQYLRRKQSSLEDARRIVSTLNDTLDVLQNIVNYCTSNQAVADEAKAQITELTTLRDETSLKVEGLKEQVDYLLGYEKKPEDADLSRFGSLAEVQQEADDLSIQRQNAEGVYLNASNLFNSCSADSDNITDPPDDGGGEGNMP